MKIKISLFCFVLTFVSLCQSVAAQSEKEMKILRMFYKEKDLVVSVTRHPKPISEVAENITVVTARDIEAMNAHTVAEVLNKIPGLFVNFNQDFGAYSLFHIQGSEDRHVLVLLDGIPWNLLSEGSAQTSSIPAGIIERIEVVKGPASSAWGSSLGGVINIITKPAGTTQRPAGSIQASAGEGDSQDFRAQVSGRAGPLGYYLFAGRQDSDGLRGSRYFDMHSLYSKWKISLSRDVDVGLSMGYSDPHIGFGDFPSADITTTGLSRTSFVTASLDARLGKQLQSKLSLYHFTQKSVLVNDSLGLGFTGPAGELFLGSVCDEETRGARGQLVWTRGIHTAVFGMDVDRGKLHQRLNAGSFLQSLGVPATSTARPDMEKWAIYANDTMVMGRWALTAGIRYDHNRITGSFISPSLGSTYRLGEDTILRASLARGFTMPPLSWTSGGGLFLDPNPSLEPEEVWSYQAGVESSALRYLWVKATFFHHKLENALVLNLFGAGPPTFNDLFINQGKIRRQGLELEAETVPVYNLSFLAGGAYVDLDPANENGFGTIYSLDIGVKYDDRESFRAQLGGHYVWWDFDAFAMAEYDDFIWDLSLNKKIRSEEKTTVELFFTARNLLNGSQYLLGDTKNPRRWVEAGVRFGF